jgi:hypothetical protein
LDRSTENLFALSEEKFAHAVGPLVRYGLLEASTGSLVSVNDPARWDKISIACTEFLSLGVHDICRKPEFQETLEILALKLTAEAAIAWRAASQPSQVEDAGVAVLSHSTSE